VSVNVRDLEGAFESPACLDEDLSSIAAFCSSRALSQYGARTESTDHVREAVPLFVDFRERAEAVDYRGQQPPYRRHLRGQCVHGSSRLMVRNLRLSEDQDPKIDQFRLTQGWKIGQDRRMIRY
jgi:hypothetical protein